MLIVQFVSVPSLVIAIKFVRLRRRLRSFHSDKNECIRKVALLIEQWTINSHIILLFLFASCYTTRHDQRQIIV